MPESVLQFDTAKGKATLRLAKDPPATGRWLVRPYVCADPSCDCPNVCLECTQEHPVSGERRQTFRFWLDLEKRELSHGRDPAPSPESLAFGSAVAAELGDPDWLALADYLRKAKDRHFRDSAGPEGAFPAEVLSGEVSMVGYSEIFPRASAFVLQIDSDNWLADDQYCVNPECRCREALLSFISLTGDTPPENLPEAPAAFYDYRRAKFVPANQPSGQPELAELFRRLRQAHPDLDLQLKARHLEMRTLYRQALRAESDADPVHVASETRSGSTAAASPLAPRSTKAGRNDPCPCGSGKKYKKCCGK